MPDVKDQVKCDACGKPARTLYRTTLRNGVEVPLCGECCRDGRRPSVDLAAMTDESLVAAFAAVIDAAGVGETAGRIRAELLRRLSRGERCAEVLRQQTCPACRQKLGEPKENPELECVCDAARAALQETNDG